MTLYYSINDALRNLEKQERKTGKGVHSLTPVSLIVPEGMAHQEDIFVLSSSPKLMDMRETDGAYQLAQLLEDVPLYGINLELILDEALSARHKNARIESALNQAFGNQPLPNTLKVSGGDEDVSGGLRHPMLAHLDKTELSSLYMAFLSFLDRHQRHYGFEHAVLGKHIDRFLDRYDGFVTTAGGKVKAEILIAFGQRQDHSPGKTVEAHMKEGRKQAGKMRIEEAHELVWAWLEEDDYQARRCRDLHRVLNLRELPRMPNWVRTDVLSCIEKESMKQVFAESLAELDPSLSLLDGAEVLRAAIKSSAQGVTDRRLEELVSHVTGRAGAYSGVALVFGEEAAVRSAESRNINLG